MKQEKKQNFIARTLKLFRPFWKSLGVVIVLMLVGQTIAIFSPYLYGRSVDAVLHHNVRLVIISVVGAFALSFFQNEILTWYRERIELTKLDEHIEHYLSEETLKKMFSFSVGQHVNEHSGVRQSIVSRGQSALNELMNNVLYTVVPNLLQILAIFGILIYFAWQVAALAAVFVALYATATYKFNTSYSPKLIALRRKRQAQARMQSEFFHNSTLVISEAQESRSVEDFNLEGKEYLAQYEKTWLGFMNFFYATYPLLIIGQYASLGLGVYYIFIGKLSTGMFVTLFSWVGSIFSNMQQIMRMQRRTIAQVIEIKRLYELLDIMPDIDSSAKGIVPETFGGSVEFRDVSFAYPYRSSVAEEEREDDTSDKREDYVVRNVSFEIPAGAKVGFVGSSGSGKSTIVNLVRRYYDPSEGSILIDGISLKEIDLAFLRSQIGNVEQKIELFDRSIRDNILFGLPEGVTVSESALAKAVTDASLDDFLKKLPEGIDTHIGENGVKVSGGERQRIGIARAFIKDPKILIFDEATSALDSINEKLIHEAINRGAQGRTTIIIAHRLSTVRDADIIFVVSKGKITDRGTHEELQKTSAEYQRLIQNQILAG